MRNLASIFDHSVACEALWYRNAARYAYRKTNLILTAPINAAFYMYIPTIPNLSEIEQSVAKLLQFKYCPHFGLTESGFSQFHGLRGLIMHQPIKFQQNPIMRHLISHMVSSSFPSSPLSPSITLSLFHSRLKTHLFHKSFPIVLPLFHPPD